MKATGIIRRVDELGRVVIPIELRNKFGITEKDPMEIYVDGTSIILKKYSDDKLTLFNPLPAPIDRIKNKYSSTKRLLRNPWLD